MTRAKFRNALRTACLAVEHGGRASLPISRERRSELRHLSPNYRPTEGTSDYVDKAEHYWGLMLTYYDLAKQAKSPLQSNSYRRVATQCRALAREAFALADAQVRREEMGSHPSG
jgi:hypothetical protein